MFSTATQRWTILKDRVDAPLKSRSDNRWESRIKAIEAVHYQTKQVREALLDVRNKVTDRDKDRERLSNRQKLGLTVFFICTMVWHE